MTRHLQVRLEDEDYEALCRKADERNLSLQQAGSKAILRWIGERSASPIEDVSKEDEGVLLRLFEIWRDRAHPYHEFLALLAKRQAAPKRGGRPR